MRNFLVDRPFASSLWGVTLHRVIATGDSQRRTIRQQKTPGD